MTMIKRCGYFFLAALLVLAFCPAAFADHLGLSAAGPVLPDTVPGPGWSAGYNGFPTWYRDTTGVVLEFTNPPDPVGNGPDAIIPGNLFSAQIGFGSEAFYWTGTADTTLPTGGRAILVLALESAFTLGDAGDGDQMVFARVRIRIDAPRNGTYVVYHPYGVNTFVVDTVAKRNINFTSDIGAVPLNFNAALKGAIGPFLKQNPPPADTNYIGDGVTDGPVTGSQEIHPTLGPQNFFRIEGPGIGGPGIRVFQTNNFVVTGKFFPGTAFKVTRATYSRTAAGATTLFGYAKTFLPFAGEAVSINAGGPPAALTRQADQWFGSLAVGNVAPPATLNFTGTGGLNPTTLTAPVKDVITISKAEYSGGLIKVIATSSDLNTATPVVLTLRTGGTVPAQTITQGVETAIPATISPASVVVTSSGGGRASAIPTIIP
jgi:hypothetical protein